MAFNKKTGTDERIIDRRNRVFELRKAGLSERQIAQALSQQGIVVSQQTVHNDLHRVIDGLVKDTETNAERLRALEIQRLDQMQASLWLRATGGKLPDKVDKEGRIIPGEVLDPDPKVMDTLLRVMKRRAELTGMDMPQRFEWTMPPELVALLQAQGLRASDVWQQMMMNLKAGDRT